MRRTSGPSAVEDHGGTSDYNCNGSGQLRKLASQFSKDGGSHSLSSSASSSLLCSGKHFSGQMLITNSNNNSCKSVINGAAEGSSGTTTATSKVKRPITVFCLLFTAALALFGLSMVVQVLLLSAFSPANIQAVTTTTSAGGHRTSGTASALGKATLLQSFFSELNSQQHSAPLFADVASDSSSDDGSSGFNEQTVARQHRQRPLHQIKTEKWHTDHWQAVKTATNERFFVYSAYIDTYKRSNLNLLNAFAGSSSSSDYDPHRFVRVIAAALLKTKLKVICCYQHPSVAATATAEQTDTSCHEGALKPIREHWNLSYSAFFLFCPLPRLTSFTTDADIAANWSLSIVRGDHVLHPTDDVPSNWLSIHNVAADDTVQPKAEEKSFAVCVKPLHYNYNRYIAFLEWIELNRLLGVGHFYFYNHTVGPEVDLILRTFLQRQTKHPPPPPSSSSSAPLITVLPWQLPIRSQTEIRTEGIFAALNDCLYRARAHRHQETLFIDLDEFIIPQQHRSLPELIAYLRRNYRGLPSTTKTATIGAYVFRNAFFYREYPNEPIELLEEGESDGQQLQLAEQLITLSKTRRRATLNVHKERSKFIAIPEDTIEVGNHFVWELTSGKSSLNVPVDIGTVHHYRNCEYGGHECIFQTASVADRRVALWASQLVSAVQRQLHFICSNGSTSQMCQL